MPVAIIVVLAAAWVWAWYFAAAVTDRTLAGWIEREAAAGRIYSCAAESIGGFPLGMSVHCADAAAEIKNTVPPYAVKAKSVTFSAAVYRPTRLTGDISGPLTVAELGQSPVFVADWTRAQIGVRGVPPDPEGISATLDGLHLDRIAAGGNGGETLFNAQHAELLCRVAGGSPRNRPVIEVTVQLSAATAPTLHPLLAVPLDIELDAVLRGIKDLSPKPWVEHVREMQAEGGTIEIKALRLTQGNAIVVGAGTLSVNAQGKLDGFVRVAIVDLEEIVPRLDIDRLIEQGIDRLSGTQGSATQGMSALDRLVPGLGDAIRQTANASLVENLKKMGEPSTIDKQPAIVLPLRFSDGAIYLGMLRVGELPPLF
ncbi:MAG: DUF2125 domain-containing protein [Xanthobacteraceae bacterium]|nr:DUF2125 domain-containing protein [Xanthobacteraceae bacterium]